MRQRSSLAGVVASGALLLAPLTVFVTPVRAVEIGYCTDDLEQAKAAGFDYAELGVRNFAELSAAEFAKLVARQKAVGLPTPVGYLFLPTDLKVVGPATDEPRETAYVRAAFARAHTLGIRTIIFGSGPARSVPPGFSREEGMRQLVAFAKRIAPLAGEHGIVLAVEAQRKEETNLVNTTAEAIAWVAEVGHPNFQVMVDFYHLALAKEDPAILLKAKSIAHVHFANPTGRVFPRDAGEYEYAPFFAALRKIDYRGRISIEAKPGDLRADAPKAIALLRAALAPGASAAPRASAAADFTCTEVIGVSVTGDWFDAGFQEGLQDGRWQARWRSHAFVDQWADPASDLWALPPDSPCAERAADPDHVIFTGVNWEYKTREAWAQALGKAVDTIRAKHPGVRRIDLLTMLRAPGNQSCGSEMTVVAPYVDEAVVSVAARHPGLVFAGPRVETPTCDVFVSGGPHYTDAGKATVAALYRARLAAH